MTLVAETPAAMKDLPESDWSPKSSSDRLSAYPLVRQARNSLRQAIDRYIPQLKLTRLDAEALQRQAAVKAGIDQLTGLMNKLDSTLLRVAVFGLVSRGKSAVLNALVGENILETGPLHGVTQWPRSIFWQPQVESVDQTADTLKIELIDTPGLDEIEGAERGKIAQEVAQQADLILFVVAGDITRTEYTALCELHQTQKPLLLVFNKTDLYPETDRQAVYANLQTLWEQVGEFTHPALQRPIDEIVMVAAAPAPIQVRTEWPDGSSTDDWEHPLPDIADLKQALIKVVQVEGPTLIALNALRQASLIENRLATATTGLNQPQAEQLIWQFAKYKAAAVALNPVALLDILGGVASDLILIRSLAKLYGFPMTGYEASRLWQAIARSSGTLILSEFGSGLLLGLGKSGAAIWSLFDSFSGVTAYAGAMAAQAGAAGYGTYAIGQAARVYLEQGCNWGPQGLNTVMRDIVAQANQDSTLERLQAEIKTSVLSKKSLSKKALSKKFRP
ncbi:MAG: GTP-binding protein [Cyanobacteria bacterium P01_A01_bin.114]